MTAGETCWELSPVLSFPVTSGLLLRFQLVPCCLLLSNQHVANTDYTFLLLHALQTKQKQTRATTSFTMTPMRLKKSTGSTFAQKKIAFEGVSKHPTFPAVNG